MSEVVPPQRRRTFARADWARSRLFGVGRPQMLVGCRVFSPRYSFGGLRECSAAAQAVVGDLGLGAVGWG